MPDDDEPAEGTNVELHFIDEKQAEWLDELHEVMSESTSMSNMSIYNGIGFALKDKGTELNLMANQERVKRDKPPEYKRWNGHNKLTAFQCWVARMVKKKKSLTKVAKMANVEISTIVSQLKAHARNSAIARGEDVPMSKDFRTPKLKDINPKNRSRKVA